MWVSGTSTYFLGKCSLATPKRKAEKEEESAQAKNKALREAGIIVPETFEQLENTIQQTFKTLKGIEKDIQPKMKVRHLQCL